MAKLNSSKSKFLGKHWVRCAARTLGLQIGNNGFLTPDGAWHSFDGQTRETWAQIEKQVQSELKDKIVASVIQELKPHEVAKIKGGNIPNITVEREAENLTPEEHAELVAAHQNLRGTSTQIRGAFMKLEGLLMRPNALLNEARLDEALAEIEALTQKGRTVLKSIRAA